MKSLRKFTRRQLILGTLAFVASAGFALAAVCGQCKGSGNGPFTCFHCKGSGKNGMGHACFFCKGRGVTPCSQCNGTGHK